MRAMILGAGGMLGHDLVASAPVDVEVRPFSKTALDITDGQAVQQSIREVRPDIVINAAAYTKVDQAETDSSSAFAVNSDAVSKLARLAKDMGIRLVHFGTDYVFDGASKTPYRETTATNPINTYGRSKLAGEAAVQASGVRFLIVRTQWLFGVCGRSFPGTMSERAERGIVSRVVQDQVGRPTYSVDLARAVWSLIEAGADGIVHVANQGIATWYDVAIRVYSVFESDHLVHPCTSSDSPAPAPRPLWSVLDTSRMEKLLGYALPTWQDAITRFLTSKSLTHS